MGALWETVGGREAVLLVNMSREDRQVILPDGRVVTVNEMNAARL